MWSLIQKKTFKSVISPASFSLISPQHRYMSYLDKFHKKSYVFDKFQYNPHHISAEEVYKVKRRKPRQKAFDEEDPNYKWAIRPPTQHRGKTLINLLEKEEKEKMLELKPFKIPHFRAGDYIELAYYMSMSEKKVNMFKALVTGVYKRYGLMHSFEAVLYAAGIISRIKFKVNDPLLIKIEVIKPATKRIRNKLSHIWEEEWNKNKVQQPVTKGRGFTPRGKKPKLQRRNVLSTLDDSIVAKATSKDSVKKQSMVMDDVIQ
jgi:ribosomal protein L19